MNRNLSADYHEYANAENEIEAEQFINPHRVCKNIVEILPQAFRKMLLDMNAGRTTYSTVFPTSRNTNDSDIDRKTPLLGSPYWKMQHTILYSISNLHKSLVIFLHVQHLPFVINTTLCPFTHLLLRMTQQLFKTLDVPLVIWRYITRPRERT